MANSRAGSVIRIDTTATFTDQFIGSIKYIGAASGTAVITQSGGNKLWEESGTSNVYNADLDITSPTGFTCTLTNSAVVYIYTE